MKNNIRIIKPCLENWESMRDSAEGRFCEKCSKCVIDLTERTDDQIQEIMKQAEGKEICGRISVKSLSALVAGIIIVSNLTFVQAQTKNDFGIATEQKTVNSTKVSGKLIFKRTKKEIPNAEVFFIHKSKYIKTTTDENGNFVLEIPNELIGKKNILYFDFDKLNKEIYKSPDRRIPNEINADIYENTTVIFTKNEEINNKEFQIASEFLTMGAVVIKSERPPDYYYFNGRSISEKKFRKLKKENPDYQFFIFNDKEGEVITRKSYLDTVRLLYSN